MPDLSTYGSRNFYHILSYGTLLGSTFFQSFVAGPVAFKTLPRPSFAQLQTGVVPVFFALQTALSPLLAFTFPGLASSVVSGGRVQSGMAGVLDERARWNTLIPFLIIAGTSVANLVWFGPATTKVMKKRRHQETKDGKKYYDAGPHSEEMKSLNKQFGMLHGVSTLVNLAGLIAMIGYGATLAEMMR